MQKPMRRRDREIPREEAMELLAKGVYGVLSTVGEGDIPYGVPLSYAVKGDVIYFHCAKEGHKLDNLGHQPQVSFCAVGEVQALYKPGNFTTHYESVIVSGAAREVSDEGEKRDALFVICEKYLPDFIEHAEADIEKAITRTCVWAVGIEHITGKRNG